MIVTSPFHEGERAVQAVADERWTAARNGHALTDAWIEATMALPLQAEFIATWPANPR